MADVISILAWPIADFEQATQVSPVGVPDWGRKLVSRVAMLGLGRHLLAGSEPLAQVARETGVGNLLDTQGLGWVELVWKHG